MDRIRKTGHLDLKACRSISGISQAKLAKKLKTHVLVVSKWERGLHKPSGKHLVQLVKLFPLLDVNKYI